MKIFKLKIHSGVDLITNSSTTIFTYSNGSVEPLKNLINEMLKVFGKTETFDDIFHVELFCDEDYYLDHSGEEAPDNYDELEKLKKSILRGEIEKPKWMKDIDEDEETSTSIELGVKDDKYKELAEKLVEFLYSTDHEAVYN
jgi:hypothetical protein